MFRLFLIALVLSSALSCTPKRVVEASSTIEDLPNEPTAEAPPDAGTPAEVVVPAEPAPGPSVALERYEAAEGFSVLLPPNPQVARNEVALKKGKVPTVQLSANLDGVNYVVTRADYPESIVKKSGPAKMLGDVRAGLAAELKGSVSDEKDLELAGHPGQTFTVAGTTVMVRARSALVGSHLYRLVIVYTGRTPEKTDEFLSSLQVSAPAPTVPVPAPAPTVPVPAAPAPAPVRK